MFKVFSYDLFFVVVVIVLDFGITLVIWGPPGVFSYSDLNYNIDEFTINVNVIFILKVNFFIMMKFKASMKIID